MPENAASPLWREGAALGFFRSLPDDVVDAVTRPPEKTITLRKTRRLPNGDLLVTLDGAIDRDSAEALRGAILVVDRATLPTLSSDEVYHHEVRGWAVVDLAGKTLGTVLGIYPGPGGDLIEVTPPATEAVPKPDTYFIPFIGQIVQTIDRAGRRLVVDPPEGLIP